MPNNLPKGSILDDVFNYEPKKSRRSNKEGYYNLKEQQELERIKRNAEMKVQLKQRFRLYDREIWYLNNSRIWVPMRSKCATGEIRLTMMTIIEKFLTIQNPYISTKDLKDSTLELYKEIITTFDDHINNKFLLHFTNGYIDKLTLQFVEGSYFSTSQIPLDYNPNVSPVDIVDDYINSMCKNDINRRDSLLASMGSMLSSTNDGVFTILYSKEPRSGKTTITSFMKSLSPEKIKVLDGLVMENAGNRFSLTGISNKSGLLFSEIPPQLSKGSTELIKRLCDPSSLYVGIEDKGSNMDEIINTLTLMATTNRLSNWYEKDDALKSRINVIFTFCEHMSKFDKNILSTDFASLDAKLYFLKIIVDTYLRIYGQKDVDRADAFHCGCGDTEDYWKMCSKTNDLEMFTEDHLETLTKEFVGNHVMKGHWQAYCEEFGLQETKFVFKSFKSGLKTILETWGYRVSDHMRELEGVKTRGFKIEKL